MLGKLALRPQLSADVVPLGFPVRLGNRDVVREALQDVRIYPPVHWPLQGVVPESFKASHVLSSEILTLPCDQRYGADEMEQMADVVLKYSHHP